MIGLLDILDPSLSTTKKSDTKNTQNSKHSPVYRKRGAEGFSPLFCFFSVNLGKTMSVR